MKIEAQKAYVILKENEILALQDIKDLITAAKEKFGLEIKELGV